MILALFALSAAMVIGGIAAVIQGFPFVRLESGLAMVIAGATVASAGAVLAGLGVVASGLRRVAHAFDARRIADVVGTMQDGIRVPAPAEAVPAAEAQAVAWPAPDSAPAVAPVLAPAARPTLPSFLVPGAAAGLLGGQSRSAPDVTAGYAEPTVPEPVPADAPAAEAPPVEPELPLPGLAPPAPAPEPVPEPVAAAPTPEPEDDLFATPETPALRPGLDAAAEPAPAAVAPPPDAREVVGRYASGGNTYVMYADGAIEAETPQGRFSFASLDELKAFVEAGGESGARGAA